MANGPTIRATTINIDRNNPSATAEAVWNGVFPVIFHATQKFDALKDRAEFLAGLLSALSGGIASVLGMADTADLLEMMAKIAHDAPPAAQRSTH